MPPWPQACTCLHCACFHMGNHRALQATTHAMTTDVGTKDNARGLAAHLANVQCVSRVARPELHSGTLRAPLLLVSGADQTITNKDGYRCAGQRDADGPHAESARIGAGERLAKKQTITTSSPRTTRRWRRCGRRHRPRAPPSACKPCHATARTQHCTDRALRPTPTHPRHDVRDALRCIRRC